jgi:hypothetical protein
MSDETLDPEKSLCWQCKHGLCIKESERQTVIHQGMTPIDEEPQELHHPFEIVPDEETEESTNVHEIDISRVAGVCYWSPAGKAVTPVKVGQVNRCNRFEEDGSLK